jgi:hypothetical protein
MKIKRIAALAAATALMTAAPAFAAVTKTGTVTVKWNTQLTATLTLHTDYNAAGAFNGGTAAGAILTNANSGTGTCTATDPTNTDLTVDFGAVTPDAAKFTNCQYKSAVNAQVTTNSSSWTLSVKATAGYPASGFALCEIANGTWPTAAPTISAAAAAVSNVSATSCPGGEFLMDGTGSTLYTGSAAANASNFGGDIDLAISNGAPSGQQTVTETYTLIAN